MTDNPQPAPLGTVMREAFDAWQVTRGLVEREAEQVFAAGYEAAESDLAAARGALRELEQAATNLYATLDAIADGRRTGVQGRQNERRFVSALAAARSALPGDGKE